MRFEDGNSLGSKIPLSEERVACEAFKDELKKSFPEGHEKILGKIGAKTTITQGDVDAVQVRIQEFARKNWIGWRHRAIRDECAGYVADVLGRALFGAGLL